MGGIGEGEKILSVRKISPLWMGGFVGGGGGLPLCVGRRDFPLWVGGGFPLYVWVGGFPLWG